MILLLRSQPHTSPRSYAKVKIEGLLINYGFSVLLSQSYFYGRMYASIYTNTNLIYRNKVDFLLYQFCLMFADEITLLDYKVYNKI